MATKKRDLLAINEQFDWCEPRRLYRQLRTALDNTTKKLSSDTISQIHNQIVEYLGIGSLNREEYIDLSNTLIAWQARDYEPIPPPKVRPTRTARPNRRTTSSANYRST
jgi:hypothetical protein